MLRGPQTAGDLRISSERLHKFADISAVEGFLEELAERPAGALVVELPRQAGARENRWAHLLSGPVAMEDSGACVSPGAEPPPDITLGEITALKANVARLETEVGELKGQLQRVCREFGIDAWE